MIQKKKNSNFDDLINTKFKLNRHVFEVIFYDEIKLKTKTTKKQMAQNYSVKFVCRKFPLLIINYQMSYFIPFPSEKKISTFFGI